MFTRTPGQGVAGKVQVRDQDTSVLAFPGSQDTRGLLLPERKLPTFPSTLPLLLWREKVGWEAVCCTFVTRCMYVRQVKRAEEEEERSNRIHGVEEMDIGGQIMSKIRTLTDHAAPSGATDAISELS